MRMVFTEKLIWSEKIRIDINVYCTLCFYLTLLLIFVAIYLYNLYWVSYLFYLLIYQYN